jgi:ribonuclease P protein component
VYPERTGSFRFGKEFRLKRELTIRTIMKTGSRRSSRFLDIRYINCGDDLRQFCIKTPKRLGNAVCRNRIKRIIREELRRSVSRIEPGMRAVVLVRRLPDGDVAARLSGDLLRFLSDG